MGLATAARPEVAQGPYGEGGGDATGWVARGQGDDGGRSRQRATGPGMAGGAGRLCGGVAGGGGGRARRRATGLEMAGLAGSLFGWFEGREEASRDRTRVPT